MSVYTCEHLAHCPQSEFTTGVGYQMTERGKTSVYIWNLNDYLSWHLFITVRLKVRLKPLDWIAGLFIQSSSNINLSSAL